MDEHLRAAGKVPSDEEKTQRIHFRFDCAQIVLIADKAVGLLKVSRDGKSWNIIQIQLSPELQRRGLGTRLIQSVIYEARTADAILRLEVLKQSPARRLYERIGFSVVEENVYAFKMLLTDTLK